MAVGVIWTYFANMPGWLFWKYLPAHVLTNMIFLAHYTLRGKGKPVWHAKWDALRSLPAVLRKRRMVQMDRQAKLVEIERVMEHGWNSPFVLGRQGARMSRILKEHER